MSQRANILEELKELKSSLVDEHVQNTYSVPEGYFEGLADQVLNRIKALEATNAVEELDHLSPGLNVISKQMPYSVPAGYFDELNTKAFALIAHKGPFGEENKTAKEELSELSPLLAGIDKKIPYAVPQGYFETLKLDNIRPAKVISITSTRWFKFAAAAVVTGVIALAGFIYFNSRPDPVDNPYAWVKKSIKKVDRTEIDELVNLADQELTGVSSTVTIPRTEEIKDLMKDVSDKELQDFLNETPETESVDILMN